MSHFSFCKMSLCRPTFFIVKQHTNMQQKKVYSGTQRQQYNTVNRPAQLMMAATVKRLRLGWTLWPASLMLNPWLRTWSTTGFHLRSPFSFFSLLLLPLLLFVLLLPLVLLLLLCLLFLSLLLLVLLFLLLCLLFLLLSLLPLSFSGC